MIQFDPILAFEMFIKGVGKLKRRSCPGVSAAFLVASGILCLIELIELAHAFYASLFTRLEIVSGILHLQGLSCCLSRSGDHANALSASVARSKSMAKAVHFPDLH
ncbi:hypothetical protein BDV19DRAFT_216423 [Aspergillus venezuelensis]